MDAPAKRMEVKDKREPMDPGVVEAIEALTGHRSDKRVMMTF